MESDEEAREHALNGPFIGSLMYLRGMLENAKKLALPKIDPEMSDEAVDAEYIIDNIAIVGGVDTVTRKLQDLYDTTGGFGTILMIAHDWDDKAENAQVDGADGYRGNSKSALIHCYQSEKVEVSSEKETLARTDHPRNAPCPFSRSPCLPISRSTS